MSKSKAGKSREAEVHFELYYRIRKAIESGLEVRGVTFSEVKPEQPVDSGFADLVIYDSTGRPWCVIEAKRFEKGKIDRNIDPNSLKVIQQALQYATLLGAPYTVTYNGRAASLFRTHEPFVPFTERKGRPYDILQVGLDAFPAKLLQDIIDLDRGVKEWASLDDKFLARLRTLHQHIASQLYSVVPSAFKGKQRKEYEEWLEKQGWDKENEKTHINFANQTAYLWINRLVFYEVVARKHGGKLSRMVSVSDLSKFSFTINSYFEKALAIDYRAVFQLDPVFDLVPITPKVAEALNSFIEEIGHYDLATLSSDVIGKVHERLIPIDERRRLGQYYTPPPIIDLICTYCIRTPDTSVFDPACGSGGFLVRSYDRLKALLPTKRHDEILKQVWGVDINRFPAHLAVMNLSMRDLSSISDDVNVFVGDFFDVHPKEQIGLDLGLEDETRPGDYLKVTAEGTERRSVELKVPASMDAVVANPPYIKQQLLNKEKVRWHLQNVGITEFSEMADIYAYFFTHATEFLKPLGRLGFITSRHWLAAEYGQDLQKFFLRRFRIEGIIAFERQAFEEPLINTCVTFLTHCPPTADDAKKSKDENCVVFLRLKTSMSAESIVALVDSSYPDEFYEERESYWICVKRQSNLANEEKWRRFLVGSAIYFDLRSSKAFCQFEDIAETGRGKTTGANEFFYFTEDKARDFKIPKHLLRGLIKNVGQSDHIDFREEDTEWRVLDLHKEVHKIAKKLGSSATNAKLHEACHKYFRAKGWNGLVEYIRTAEAEDIHKRESLKNRSIWFDLVEIPRPPIVIPKEYWRVSVVYNNPHGLAVDQQLYDCTPKEGVDEKLLLGILNSDVFTLMREVDGIDAAGEAMTRNRLSVADLNRLKIPDPRKIANSNAEQIKKALRDLIEEERQISEDKRQKLKNKLNTAVMRAMGLERRTDELEEEVHRLLSMRVRAGTKEKEVLVK